MNLHVDPASVVPRLDPRTASEEDHAVARRLQAARKARGLTQQHLAHAVGITYPQLQKYESGRNRISAGRLAVLARALDVPVAAFFEDAAPAESAAP